MKLNIESIIGQQFLSYGTVKIASNKPDWCCLIVCAEDEDSDTSILFDEKHDYVDVSINHFKVDESLSEEEQMRNRMEHIELTNEDKASIKEFIYQHCNE